MRPSDSPERAMTGVLSHAVTLVRRPSPNADLPFGAADLLWVTNTATLIFGKSDAILVDTFMTLDENRVLIDWVGSFGRTLRYVYVTHGHVDHYYGVHEVLESFPNARAISNPESAARTPGWGAGRRATPSTQTTPRR